MATSHRDDKKAAVGRPPKYGREQVQEAALRLVDERGLDALTMRNLAEVLGTGAMTLYRHVQDRAELEVLVVDQIFSEVDLLVDGVEPQRRIEDLCIGAWRAMRRHPQAARLTLTRRTQAPNALRLGEQLALQLKDCGLEGVDLLNAFRVLLSVVVGAIEGDTVIGDRASGANVRVQVADNDFPTLSTMSATADSLDAESLFRGMVAVVLSRMTTGG